MLGRPDCGTSLCNNHVYLEPDQLGRQVAETFLAPLRIPVLKDEVLALDVAALAQPLAEGFKRWIGARVRTTHTKQPPYPVHCRCLLCLSGERRYANGEGDDEPDDTEPHSGVLHNIRVLTAGEQQCIPL